jgi:hypothetical protein
VTNIDRIEWLDAIHAHYDREMLTPVHAAAEVLATCKGRWLSSVTYIPSEGSASRIRLLI